MAKRRPAALSIRPEEYEAAKARADGLGLNFSAYVNSLIRKDMRERGSLTLQETPAPPAEPLPPRQEVVYPKPKRRRSDPVGTGNSD